MIYGYHVPQGFAPRVFDNTKKILIRRLHLQEIWLRKKHQTKEELQKLIWLKKEASD